MHKLHLEWLPILKTHCNKEKQAALDAWIGTSVERYVCSKHFKEGAPHMIDTKLGLEWLRTEFCGEAWLDGGARHENSWEAKRKHPNADESAPHAKRAPDPHSTIHLHGSIERRHDTSPDTIHGTQESLFAQLAQLNDLIQHILEHGTLEEVEKLRSMFLASSLGTELVVEVAASVVRFAEERIPPHLIGHCSRPLLKALLDTFDAMKVQVRDKDLAMHIGVAQRTVHATRLERLEVRLLLFSSTPSELC